MSKFKKFLRRQPKVIRRTESSDTQPTSQHCDVILDQPDGFDLVRSKDKDVFVGCWLDTQNIRWGRHNEQETAIMHLTLETVQSLTGRSDFRVNHLAVELTFAPGTSAIQVSSGESAATSNDISDPGEPSVYVCGTPAPLCKENKEAHDWTFKGRRIALQGGLATTARWEWSGVQPCCLIHDCGNLHCGVIIRHGGLDKPVSITYQVRGQARENVSESYCRPYTFGGQGEDLPTWLLRPRQADVALSDEDIKGLDEEVMRRFGKISLHQLTTEGILVQGPSDPSIPAVGGAISRVVRGREYGPSSVGGHAMVVQGDVQHLSVTYVHQGGHRRTSAPR